MDDISDDSDLVTEEDLNYARCKLLSSNWKRAGRELGLTNVQLDRIESDNVRLGLGLDETIYQMLRKWREICGLEATKRRLKSCLEKFEINENEDEIKDDFTEQVYKDILEKIQTDMENNYSDLQLPHVTWFLEKMLPLEEFYVDLTMEVKDKYGNDTLVDVKLENLFDKLDDKLPKRILIEGHPGYGKTTLICKLASDWAHGIAYIREKFDLIFVVLLRDFEGDLESSLLEQCDIEKMSATIKKKVIAQTENKVLLLMDGYDELSESNKSILLSVLQKKTYPLMTVIVTSRTEEMHLQEMKKSPLAKIGAKTKDYSFISLWNKRIQIKGISEENRKEFLEKYFQSDPAEIYEKMSHLIGDKISSLYECPLFLLLLAVLIEEEEIQEVSTRTELYKKVFNFIVNRYLDRNNVSDDVQEIDIFDFNQEISVFNSQVLVKFGELVLEKLEINILSFNKEEIIKRCEGDETILNLGILHKNTSFKRKKLEFSYEPLHKTFLEFLASFYVFSLKNIPVTSSGKFEFNDKIYSLLNSGFLFNPTSLFCPFLVGLLGRDAHNFLNLVSQYKGLLHNTFLFDIHSEMEKTEENNERILTFVPSIWRIGNSENSNWYFNSDLHCSLLQLALEKNIIQELVWDLKCEVNIPDRCHFPVLELISHKNYDDKVEININKEISCDELKFDKGFSFFSWNTFKLIVNNINFKVISFKSEFLEDSKLIRQLQKEIMEGQWKNLNIKLLECNQIIPDMIKLSETLLKKNAIQSLFGDCRRVMNDDATFKMIAFSVQSVIDASFESDALKRLYFTSFSDFRRKIVIDLSQGNILKKKNWDFFHVDKKLLWKNYHECSDSFRIKAITFATEREHQLHADVKVLSLCSGLGAISLPSDLFYEYIKHVPSSWSGFQTITEIHLYVTIQSSVASFDLLSRFHNLSTLSIDSSDFKVDPKYSDRLILGTSEFLLDILSFSEAYDGYLFVNIFLENLVQNNKTNDDVSNRIIEKRKKFRCRNLRFDFGMLYPTFQTIENIITLCMQLLLNNRVNRLDFIYSDVPSNPFNLYLLNLISSPEKFHFTHNFFSANRDFIIFDFEKSLVETMSVSLLAN